MIDKHGCAMKPVPESQTLSIDTTVRSGGLDLVGITAQLVAASRQKDETNGTYDPPGLMGQPGIKFHSKSTPLVRLRITESRAHFQEDLTLFRKLFQHHPRKYANDARFEASLEELEKKALIPIGIS